MEYIIDKKIIIIFLIGISFGLNSQPFTVVTNQMLEANSACAESCTSHPSQTIFKACDDIKSFASIICTQSFFTFRIRKEFRRNGGLIGTNYYPGINLVFQGMNGVCHMFCSTAPDSHISGNYTMNTYFDQIPGSSYLIGSVSYTVEGEEDNITFNQSLEKICQDTLLTLQSPDRAELDYFNLVPDGGLFAVFDNYNTLTISPILSTCNNCTFKYFIIDQNGCEFEGIKHIKFGKAVVSSTTDVSSYGGNDGSATIAMINGDGPYYISLNDEDGILYQNAPFTITGLSAGTYQLSSTDRDGCMTTTSFTINGVDCPLLVSDSIVHIACYGDTTGSILLTIDGAEGMPEIVWDNRVGMGLFADSLKAGSYRVTISDDRCILVKTYTVSQPIQPLTIHADITHPNCGASNGQIILRPEGGWKPYVKTYPDTLADLSTGLYPLQVVDSLGCKLDSTIRLLAVPGAMDIPVFVSAPDDVTISCADAPDLEYPPLLWYGYPGCGVDSVDTVVPEVGIAGTSCADQEVIYTWSYRDTFGHEVVHTQKVTIQSDRPKFNNPPGDMTIPYADYRQALLTDTLGCTNGGSGICDISGVAMHSVDSTMLSSCEGIVTRTWKAYFCDGKDSLVHVQRFQVERDEIDLIIRCTSMESSVRFEWNAVAGVDHYTITVYTDQGDTLHQGNIQNNYYEINELSNGTKVNITVTTRSNNGCIDKTEASSCIAQDCSGFSIDISGTERSCAGDTFMLSTKTITDASYRWNTGETTPSIRVAPEDTTVYSVTVSDVTGCTASATHPVEVLQRADVEIQGDSVVCKGQPIILTAHTTFEHIRFYWTIFGEAESISFYPDMDVIYYITAYDSITGCIGYDSFAIKVIQPQVLTITGVTEVCMGQSGIISTTAIGQYLWSTGDTSKSIMVTSIETTDYALTVTDNTGCITSATYTVESIQCDDDCNIKLQNDGLSLMIGQAFSIRILENDIIPYDSFTVNLMKFDKSFFSDLSIEDGIISGSVKKPFFDPIHIEYEVCTPDCEDCSRADLILTNEALKDIIQTTVIIPGSEGDNARLRFTKDDILEGSELYIFNRNGDNIFYMKDYDQSWNADGYPGGIYYYVLRYNGVDIKKVLTVMK